MASQLSNAVKRIKKSLVYDIWDSIEGEWAVRTATERSVLKGALVPNKYLGDFRYLKSKSSDYFERQKSLPKFFGLAARSYVYKGLQAAIEIRFDGKFYVGIFGHDSEWVMDPIDVENFFKNYDLPNGCTRGKAENNNGKGRIIVITPYRFDQNTEELFQLVDHKKRKDLVALIFDIAEGIISNLIRLNLVTIAK